VYNNLLEVQEWQSGGATTATKYAYDGAHEWAELSGTNALNVRDLYGPSAILARTVSAGLTNAGVAWYFVDQQGSTTDLIGATSPTYVSNHSSYDGYGNETDTSASVVDQHGYAGYFTDRIVHLDHAGMRWYSPTTGTWTSIDPIGFAAGQSNLSEYAANDPTNGTDPSGLEMVDNRARIAAAYQQNMRNMNVYGAQYGHGNAFSQEQIDAVPAWVMTHLGVSDNTPQQMPRDYRLEQDFGLWGAFADGMTDGLYILENAATFHQIQELNDHVNQSIQQNGGVYRMALT
jgi:RHS repeat-associated protein